MTWRGHNFIDNCRDSIVWEYVIRHAEDLEEANAVAEVYVMSILSNN